MEPIRVSFPYRDSVHYVLLITKIEGMYYPPAEEWHSMDASPDQRAASGNEVLDGAVPDAEVMGGPVLDDVVVGRTVLGDAVVDGPVLDAAGLEVAEAAVRLQLIDHIRMLEELKGSICAAQARAAAVFDESSRRSQARAGMKADQLGRGVAAQIGLARRESPHTGTRLLGLARILSTEMPHTLRALSLGVISEWRATILVRETACLTLSHRQKVDELIAGDQAALGQLGDRKLIAAIKTLAYGLDPLSVVKRAAKAASDRFVSCRPAPDTMAYVSALLPVAQGVGVMAALTRKADQARASGDPRSKGQVMADTFVELLTGQARAEDLRVEVQLIMTDRTLLHGILPNGEAGNCVAGNSGAGSGGVGNCCGGNCGVGSHSTGKGGGPVRTASGDPAESAGESTGVYIPDGAEPALLAGYGVVPAQWARDLLRSSDETTGRDSDKTKAVGGNKIQGVGWDRIQGVDSGKTQGMDRGEPRGVRRKPRTEVWLRRLYTAPGSGRLTAMDSRARLVPEGLARLIAARDQICRTPWCGAPIRHYDHVKPFRDGSPTSIENIQGLCEACNQAKEAPGWSARCEETPAPGKERDRAGVDQRSMDRTGRHTVVTTTPTGHSYRSIAPPLPGQR